MQLLLSDHGSKSVVIQYDRQHDADRILSILADIYKMYRITGPNIRLTAGSIYFEYIDKSKIVPASIKATLKVRTPQNYPLSTNMHTILGRRRQNGWAFSEEHV